MFVHPVGDQCAGGSAEQLGDDIRDRESRLQLATNRQHESDHRVEVSAADRQEYGDQHAERRDCRERVDQELDTDVVRQSLGGDARADHRHHQGGGPHELSEDRLPGWFSNIRCRSRSRPWRTSLSSILIDVRIPAILMNVNARRSHEDPAGARASRLLHLDLLAHHRRGDQRRPTRRPSPLASRRSATRPASGCFRSSPPTKAASRACATSPLRSGSHSRPSRTTSGSSSKPAC